MMDATRRARLPSATKAALRGFSELPKTDYRETVLNR
jgi:hypothetical protein